MSTDDSTPPFKSSYPQLELPKEGFQSKIPPSLLTGDDPQLEWLMHEVSKDSQATEFACHGVVQLSDYLRELNGKTARTIENVARARNDLEILKEKAAIAEPFLKPMAQFLALWEYRAFRWVFYSAGFFLTTYVLPAYLAHPISLKTLFTFLFGS